ESVDVFHVGVLLSHQATAKGVPDHNLRLKVGSVYLFNRNLNVADDLTNGIKVIVAIISHSSTLSWHAAHFFTTDNL
ncbi:hypothetical protein J6590_102522, partial [Homalodisca vitripennis]